jgi:glucans biosynthesis protein
MSTAEALKAARAAGIQFGIDGDDLVLEAYPGGRRNFEINPMNLSTDNNSTQPTQLSQVQRCGARARAGTSCQAPAIRGRRRCRLHGGLSPGAPKGKRNGNYTTGEWTQEAIAERRWLRALVRHCTGKGRAI